MQTIYIVRRRHSAAESGGGMELRCRFGNTNRQQHEKATSENNFQRFGNVASARHGRDTQ